MQRSGNVAMSVRLFLFFCRQKMSTMSSASLGCKPSSLPVLKYAGLRTHFVNPIRRNMAPNVLGSWQLARLTASCETTVAPLAMGRIFHFSTLRSRSLWSPGRDRYTIGAVIRQFCYLSPSSPLAGNPVLCLTYGLCLLF